MTRTGIWWLLASSILVALVGVPAASAVTPVPSCTSTADPNQPPCNPWLANSVSSATHGNNYRQQSYAEATARTGKFSVNQLSLSGIVPIWVHTSAAYPDGAHVLWMSVAGTDQIVKVDEKTFKVIAQTPPGLIHPGIGAAYYELNKDNQVVRLRQGTIEAWGDAVPGNEHSKIAEVASYKIPAADLCRGEGLVGIAHTYDGHIVVGTQYGQVMVLPADPRQWNAKGVLAEWSMNGAKCGDKAVTAGQLQNMTNNVAVDENGGVFLVSNQAMYKVSWDGHRLAESWHAPYGQGTSGALGAGSGSTPTLMGVGGSQDKLVVITDAQPVMHYVAYWRDQVPLGWKPIAAGRDPRVACDIPVNFGDPTRTQTTSDQSIAVAGYSAVVVDNTLRGGFEKVYQSLPAAQQPLAIGLAGGDPSQAPAGMTRIDWNPVTRTCSTVWNRPDASFPNGVPAISRGSGLVLGISLKKGAAGQAQFGLRALNLSDGKDRWFSPGPGQVCGTKLTSPAIAGLLSPLLALAGRIPIAAELTNACENSLFAGITMGDDGAVYTGTFLGATRWLPNPTDIG